MSPADWHSKTHSHVPSEPMVCASVFCHRVISGAHDLGGDRDYSAGQAGALYDRA